MRAVNLIPAEQRSGGTVGSRSGGAVFFVVGLLAGLVVLAGLYGLAHHRLESRRGEAATLNARVLEVKEQAAKLAPYTTFMAMREQRMQAVEQLVGSRFDWSNSMGELSRVLPGGVALTAIQGTVGATSGLKAQATPAAAATSTVTSSTPPGATPTVTLSGCAASQSLVAQTLVRLRLIGGVSTVALQSSTKSSSSAAGSSSGSCPGTDPVFSIQVTFNPLPAVASTTSAAESSSSSASTAAAGAGSSSGATNSSYTPSGASAR
jgi:Tfp pilus assembly protein PilN